MIPLVQIKVRALLVPRAMTGLPDREVIKRTPVNQYSLCHDQAIFSTRVGCSAYRASLPCPSRAIILSNSSNMKTKRSNQALDSRLKESPQNQDRMKLFMPRFLSVLQTQTSPAGKQPFPGVYIHSYLPSSVTGAAKSKQTDVPISFNYPLYLASSKGPRVVKSGQE
ncbi:hypothetical protein RRG08_066351 [Elysia crispata]|uniref:Uncharacterized protein n=1 Tax=Elysia crispata TaxID=231223 RepID=A0AAE0Y9B0_9GAST|nr:hypothetical protein RRG08_066351 [Elysia crispata]